MSIKWGRCLRARARKHKVQMRAAEKMSTTPLYKLLLLVDVQVESLLNIKLG